MDKQLYNKPYAAPNAAEGLIGKPPGQVNFGTQFIPTDKFSIQGNREFDTYEHAENYVFNDYSAFPGIVITVSDDVDIQRNGVYLVMHDEVSEINKNGLKLSRLSQTDDMYWIIIKDEN